MKSWLSKTTQTARATSLRTRLLALVGLITLPSLVVAIMASVGLSNVTARLEQSTRQTHDQIGPLLDLEERLFTTAGLVDRTVADLDVARHDGFTVEAQRIARTIETLRDRYPSQADQDLMDEVNDLWIEVWDAGDDAFIQLRTGDVAGARALLGEIEPAIGKIATSLTDLYENASAAMAEREAAARALRDRTRLTLGLALALTLLSVAVVLSQMRRSVAAPLALLQDAINHYRDGDLAHRVEAPSRDEIGEAISTLNSMASALQEKHFQLTHRALHDPLTELANRLLFEDRLRHALRRAQRSKDHVAILFIDIDDFKTINDIHGHGAGDALLIAIGERILQAVRNSDTAARLGGDEFAVLLDPVAAHEEAEMIAHRILDELRAPLPVNGSEVSVTASVGVASTFDHAWDADALMATADTAMYSVKRSGKFGVRAVTPEMQEEDRRKSRLQQDLRIALQRGDIDVYYQPLVDIKTGRTISVEALARWTHAELGPVSPGEFIPVAESSGLIVDLGRYVLRKAAEQVRRWQVRYPVAADLMVSVNLSSRELLHPDFDAELSAALAETAFDPRKLILEVTESTFIADLTVVEKMERFRGLGGLVALDDFGTGYSSLNRLHRLPVDVLKIDRSFIRNVDSEPKEATLVKAIIGLGADLGAKVVAEGIETEEQRLLLEKLGCPVGQGFLFARPLDPESFEARLLELEMTQAPRRDEGVIT